MALEITDVSSTGTGTATRTPKKELGKNDFLLLLTKQLQNQDPMKPMDNMEFVNQMASFSTLEQITNLSKNIEAVMGIQSENYKVQAMGLLGKTVQAQLATQPEPVIGVASRVKFVDGEAVFTVGENQIRMSDIQLISNEALS